MALLASPTILVAALTAGVSESTAHRWLKDEGFRATYRECRRAVVDQGVAQLQRATGKAVETLCLVMDDQDAPANARVSAARVVLEMALRGIEIEDFAARLDALERERHHDPII